MTDETLAFIGRHMPHLIELRVWQCAGVTRAGFEAVKSPAPALRRLEVGGLVWHGSARG